MNTCTRMSKTQPGPGPTLLVGGEPRPGPGSFYPPTVLTDCTPDMLIMREETFGPIAPVRVVPDFAAALTEAADDRCGLAATVLTGNMAHAQEAWRSLPVGTVKINAVFGGAPGGAFEPCRASGTGFGFGPELVRRDDRDEGGALVGARRLTGALRSDMTSRSGGAGLPAAGKHRDDRSAAVAIAGQPREPSGALLAVGRRTGGTDGVPHCSTSDGAEQRPRR